jgi:hypothetical protein
MVVKKRYNNSGLESAFSPLKMQGPENANFHYQIKRYVDPTYQLTCYSNSTHNL